MQPEEVAGRQFRTVARGYDPAEVRGFLQAVAVELRHARQQAAYLQARLLERRPGREELIDALGDEVRSILLEAEGIRRRARSGLSAVEEHLERFLSQLAEVGDVLDELGSAIRSEWEAIAAGTEAAERTSEPPRPDDPSSSPPAG